MHLAAGSSSGDELRRLIAAAQWLGGAPRVTVPGLAGRSVIPAAVLPLSPPVVTPAAPATPAALPAGIAVQVVGDEITAEIGTRRYRVRGLFANRGAEVMKVNLRIAVDRAGSAENTVFHVDTLNLYQTRFRQAFTAAAAPSAVCMRM